MCKMGLQHLYMWSLRFGIRVQGRGYWFWAGLHTMVPEFSGVVICHMLQDSMSNLRMRWLVYQPAPMLIPCLREVANGHESSLGSEHSGLGPAALVRDSRVSQHFLYME